MITAQYCEQLQQNSKPTIDNVKRWFVMLKSQGGSLCSYASAGGIFLSTKQNQINLKKSDPTDFGIDEVIFTTNTAPKLDKLHRMPHQEQKKPSLCWNQTHELLIASQLFVRFRC